MIFELKRGEVSIRLVVKLELHFSQNWLFFFQWEKGLMTVISRRTKKKSRKTGSLYDNSPASCLYLFFFSPDVVNER